MEMKVERVNEENMPEKIAIKITVPEEYNDMSEYKKDHDFEFNALALLGLSTDYENKSNIDTIVLGAISSDGVIELITGITKLADKLIKTMSESMNESEFTLFLIKLAANIENSKNKDEESGVEIQIETNMN